MGCPSHLALLMAEHGLKSMQRNAKGLIIDIYYCFQRSVRRVASLKWVHDILQYQSEENCEASEIVLAAFGEIYWMYVGYLDWAVLSLCQYLWWGKAKRFCWTARTKNTDEFKRIFWQRCIVFSMQCCPYLTSSTDFSSLKHQWF